MILLLIGLIFGSFITALSWRFPRSISNIHGRSFCDSCKNEIKWYDNIPVISYIFLGGKCRNCRNKISIRYPLIEIVSSIGFYLIGWNFTYLLLFLVFLLIFIVDLEHQIIPDGFIHVGVFIFLFSSSGLSYSNIFSGLLASVILLFIHLVTKGRGMGLGDVKFAFLAGLVVGLNDLMIWFFVAFLTGGIAGSILVLGKIAKMKDKIAFGPFLVISIPITLIWGEKILKVLLH